MALLADHRDELEGEPRACEVCSVAGVEQPSSAQFVSSERCVWLCEAHAEVARLEGVTTLDELRSLFREPRGQRCVLPRRADEERRVFPPRPEGRRRGPGRRRADVT